VSRFLERTNQRHCKLLKLAPRSGTLKSLSHTSWRFELVEKKVKSIPFLRMAMNHFSRSLKLLTHTLQKKMKCLWFTALRSPADVWFVIWLRLRLWWRRSRHRRQPWRYSSWFHTSRYRRPSSSCSPCHRRCRRTWSAERPPSSWRSSSGKHRTGCRTCRWFRPSWCAWPFWVLLLSKFRPEKEERKNFDNYNNKTGSVISTIWKITKGHFIWHIICNQIY